MGRLIDVDSLILEQQSLEDVGQGIMEFYSKEQINNAETVEAIPKSDYEARLKADMVAMLEEIDLQFDEICFYKNMGEWKTVPEIKGEYKAIIRERINSLKEDQDENNNEI